MIPTTDEMDKVTPEERVQLKGECSKCGEWNDLVRKQDSTIPNYKCKCDSSILIKSIQSLRTWRPKKKRR